MGTIEVRGPDTMFPQKLQALEKLYKVYLRWQSPSCIERIFAINCHSPMSHVLFQCVLNHKYHHIHPVWGIQPILKSHTRFLPRYLVVYG